MVVWNWSCGLNGDRDCWKKQRMRLLLATLTLCEALLRSEREVRLRDCLARHSVVSVWPTDEAWPQAVRSWNMVLHAQPYVVVYPENTQEVSSAVRCAREVDLKIQARSGGHSYMGYGSGGVDGRMVIDLHALDQIITDPQTLTLYAGPGVRMMRLRKILDDKNLAFPIGQCPQVGLGGWFGVGLSSMTPYYGLGIDNLISVQMVLADGSVITVSETEHPDLFWGLRGSCNGNFGIITWFHSRLYRAPQFVHVVHYAFPASQLARVMFNLVSQPERWTRYLKWIDFHNDHTDVVVKARAIDPTPEQVTEMHQLQTRLGDHHSVWDAQLRWQDWYGESFEPPNPNPALARAANHEIGEAYVRKFSFILDRSHYPPYEVLEQWSRLVQNAPMYVDIELVTLGRPERVSPIVQLPATVNPQGPIATATGPVPTANMSWPHETGTYVFATRVKMGRPLTFEETAYFETIRSLIAPYTTGYSYCNYMDASLDHWPQRFYGPSLSKLKVLQLKYDPDGIFDNPQTISRVPLEAIINNTP